MIPHSRPTLGAEEQAAAARVLASGRLAQGPEVAAFEGECAAFCGVRHGVAVSSGTAALHLALLALGIGPGRRVAIPAYACAALLQAVQYVRATPVLVDVGADGNLDPAAVPTGVDATIVAHLFGRRVAPLPQGVVIDDLAQALAPGAAQGRPLSIASFYATKLMTSGGEGGMLLTDDPGLAEEARDRRDYDGRDDAQLRFAYKMTELQATIGRVQLQRLPGFLKRRAELAEQYNEALHGLPLQLPPASRHLYYRYVVATPETPALLAHLHARGIEAKRPVWVPLHRVLGGDCTGAQRCHETNSSLPIYPSLTDHEQGLVIRSLVEFFAGRAG